jgi:hypothetical protein
MPTLFSRECVLKLNFELDAILTLWMRGHLEERHSLPVRQKASGQIYRGFGITGLDRPNRLLIASIKEIDSGVEG